MSEPVVHERRKHKRFKVREGAHVILWPDFSRQGQILDISMNGLAFLYIANGDPPGESSELDILLVNERFNLDMVPFRIISDIETEKASPIPAKPYRRMGVQFGTLDIRQESKLKSFIENHTIGEA